MMLNRILDFRVFVVRQRRIGSPRLDVLFGVCAVTFVRNVVAVFRYREGMNRYLGHKFICLFMCVRGNLWGPKNCDADDIVFMIS